MHVRAGLLWMLAVTAVAGAVGGWLIVRRGFSTRDDPSWVETAVARRVRALGIPPRARDAKNPVPPGPAALAAGLEHFADHCAVCHANDGSGRTAIGRNLYPRAPDMRLAATLRLTDGELFYIIQNGIRLTGMPAWGDGSDEHVEDSWHLVHFIRHLNELTPAELKEMERLNPKTPAEIEEEREDEAFLRGGAPPPAPESASPVPPAQPHRH